MEVLSADGPGSIGNTLWPLFHTSLQVATVAMAPLVPPQARAAFEAQWNVTIQTASNSSATCAPELFGGTNRTGTAGNGVPDLLNDGTSASAARAAAVQSAIASCGARPVFTQHGKAFDLSVEVFAPIYGASLRGNGM